MLMQSSEHLPTHHDLAAAAPLRDDLLNLSVDAALVLPQLVQDLALQQANRSKRQGRKEESTTWPYTASVRLQLLR